MQGIGDTLREARMRQKIDVSEVEAKTKIRAKYLRALENEEFDLLPGSTFVRSFLRTYAEFLGLDAHMLVEEFRAQYEPRGEAELPPLSSQPGRRERRGGGRRRDGGRPGPGLGMLLGLGVAAVLVILLIIGLVGGSSTDDGKRSGTSTSKQAKRGAKQKKRRSGAPAAPARPTRVTLRVTPAEATYVCVDHGSGTTVAFEGTISSPQTWRARHLRLNLGKTSAKVRVNGKLLAIAPGPEPVGYDLTTKKTKPIPAGQRPCE